MRRASLSGPFLPQPLVLQDGLRVGGIAPQSADEVEPIDVLALDRIEIVKGPATLLYGSNAIGGVVNGISTNDVYQNGLSGYLTAFGGTNNWEAGGSGGLKYGFKLNNKAAKIIKFQRLYYKFLLV